MRLHDFLDYRAREQGEAEFAIQGDRRITYRAAQAEVNRLANALVDSRITTRRPACNPFQKQHRIYVALFRVLQSRIGHHPAQLPSRARRVELYPE